MENNQVESKNEGPQPEPLDTRAALVGAINRLEWPELLKTLRHVGAHVLGADSGFPLYEPAPAPRETAASACQGVLRQVFATASLIDKNKDGIITMGEIDSLIADGSVKGADARALAALKIIVSMNKEDEKDSSVKLSELNRMFQLELIFGSQKFDKQEILQLLSKHKDRQLTDKDGDKLFAFLDNLVTSLGGKKNDVRAVERLLNDSSALELDILT